MKHIRKPFLISFFFIACCLMITCRNDKGIPDYNGYPEEVGKLIYTKCATSGCHTDASKDAAGGLSLQSWDALFQGGRSGAAVIPYRSDYSTLCYFTNTYPDLGVTLSPTMPYNKPALSREDELLLKNWIDHGAASSEGFVKFSDNPNRKKYYVTNQGCDIVTVFDAESGLQMRYVNVGQSPGTDAPHMIRVSPDKQYWYVISLTGNYLEKYRASDDSYAGRAYIGSGYWNAFTISPNSQTAYCSDMRNSGAISTVDLATMTADSVLGFYFPHGVAIDPTGSTLLVTQQISPSNGGYLYKMQTNDISSPSQINLFSTTPGFPLNPHEVNYTPDGSKYYVTCQGTSEVRVFQSSNDSLLKIIPVGASPTEMAFSTSKPYLFVSCTEDTLSFPGKRGSVAVINRLTDAVEKFVYTGWQPHGIAVDDTKKLVVVVNRNYATDGPAPHHAAACGGRNGYVTFINLNTFDMVTVNHSGSVKKIEVSVDPYSVGVR